MGYLEVAFVLIILLTGVWLIIIMQREFSDREARKREEQQSAEGEARRSAVLRGNSRSATRR